MAAKKIEIDPKALEALRTDPAVIAERRRLARGIASKANATLTRRQDYPNYDVGEGEGDDPHVSVFTRSNHAKHSNAVHNTLIKVVG